MKKQILLMAVMIMLVTIVAFTTSSANANPGSNAPPAPFAVFGNDDFDPNSSRRLPSASELDRLFATQSFHSASEMASFMRSVFRSYGFEVYSEFSYN